MDLRAEWQMLHFLQCPTHGISGRYIVIHFHRDFKYLLLKIHEVAVYGYGETSQTLRRNCGWHVTQFVYSMWYAITMMFVFI